MLKRWTQRRRQRKVVLYCIYFLLVITLIITAWSADFISSKDASETDLVISKAVGPLTALSAIYIFPYENTTILNPTNRCSEGNGSNVFSLFIVISSPSNSYARSIIRSGFKFFLKEYGEDKVNELLFFIGLPDPDDTLTRRKLINEAKLHRDIIIEDFRESYLNLTLKTLRMLKWVEWNCNATEFLIKLDDDLHLNLHKFYPILESLSGTADGRNLIGGKLYVNPQPIRDPNSKDGKWYTPVELWPEPTFPNYIAGTSYVLGKNARTKIYSESLQHNLFHLEDVFVTGIIGNKALGFNLTDFPISSVYWSPLFNLYLTPCDIQNHYVGIHFLFKSFDYLECWARFNSKGFQCDNWPLFTNCWWNLKNSLAIA